MSDSDINDEDRIEEVASEEEMGETTENVAIPDDNGDILRNFFADCFVQYSSYVVRDRAIPDIDDGLKPVQRRILHCMHEVDDGRFNKVAGVVGDTMHYHPHGDASIAGALTVLANKEYFIDRQGNFGNILTGMKAAAPRYIECRLTEMAKETMFNPEITEFTDTYDGRLKEPIRLPAKVPALLMLGSDGIAVGMSTTIFPHNFGELLKAEICILKGEEFKVLPDFPQGAIMDASEYEDGAGKIKVRARIEPDGDKRLIIREVPPDTTTDSLLESIEKAAKRGKVKIASINDYTAENVCIEIALQRGIHAEETLKELYAYTDCEKSLTSQLLVIKDNIPEMMTVSDVLRRNVAKLKEYLKMELELAIHQLQEKVLDKTLAQIFVENRIYKRIEHCTTIELIFQETMKGLLKFKDQFYREITNDDIEKLLQIPIRRISAFDIARNQQEIADMNAAIAEKQNSLANLVQFTIDYIQHIYDKYADAFPRRTEIAQFDSINVKEVAKRDVKVYFDRKGHFVGTNVKPSNKDASPLLLTDFDKICIIRGDGMSKIMDIPEKEYVGATKYLIAYNKEQVYCMLYRHRVQGTWYAKRFRFGACILDKEYRIIPEDCIIEEFYVESEMVLEMETSTRTRRTREPIIVDFSKIEMRSREAKGFKVTSYPVNSIKVISRGKQSDASGEGTDETASDSSDGTAADGAVGTNADGAESAETTSAEGAGATVAEAAGEPSAAPPIPSEKPQNDDSDKIQRDGPKRMFQLSFFDDEETPETH